MCHSLHIRIFCISTTNSKTVMVQWYVTVWLFTNKLVTVFSPIFKNVTPHILSFWGSLKRLLLIVLQTYANKLKKWSLFLWLVLLNISFKLLRLTSATSLLSSACMHTYTHLHPCYIFTVHGGRESPFQMPLSSGRLILQQHSGCVNKRGPGEVRCGAIVVFTLAGFLCAMKAWRYSNSQRQKGAVCRRDGW